MFWCTDLYVVTHEQKLLSNKLSLLFHTQVHDSNDKSIQIIHYKFGSPLQIMFVYTSIYITHSQQSIARGPKTSGILHTLAIRAGSCDRCRNSKAV